MNISQPNLALTEEPLSFPWRPPGILQSLLCAAAEICRAVVYGGQCRPLLVKLWSLPSKAPIMVFPLFKFPSLFSSVFSNHTLCAVKNVSSSLILEHALLLTSNFQPRWRYVFTVTTGVQQRMATNLTDVFGNLFLSLTHSYCLQTPWKLKKHKVYNINVWAYQSLISVSINSLVQAEQKKCTIMDIAKMSSHYQCRTRM